MSDKPFTEAEAALKLGISKTSLVRERLAGKVKPIRIGQRIIRYTDEILEEYLRQCRNGSDNLAHRRRVAPGRSPAATAPIPNLAE